MSMRQLESAICSELRRVSGNSKWRVKDMMEWATTELKPQAGEVVYHCPLNGVWVAVNVTEVPK